MEGGKQKRGNGSCPWLQCERRVSRAPRGAERGSKCASHVARSLPMLCSNLAGSAPAAGVGWRIRPMMQAVHNQPQQRARRHAPAARSRRPGDSPEGTPIHPRTALSGDRWSQFAQAGRLQAARTLAPPLPARHQRLPSGLAACNELPGVPGGRQWAAACGRRPRAGQLSSGRLPRRPALPDRPPQPADSAPRCKHRAGMPRRHQGAGQRRRRDGGSACSAACLHHRRAPLPSGLRRRGL